MAIPWKSKLAFQKLCHRLVGQIARQIVSDSGDHLMGNHDKVHACFNSAGKRQKFLLTQLVQRTVNDDLGVIMRIAVFCAKSRKVFQRCHDTALLKASDLRGDHLRHHAGIGTENTSAQLVSAAQIHICHRRKIHVKAQRSDFRANGLSDVKRLLRIALCAVDRHVRKRCRAQLICHTCHRSALFVHRQKQPDAGFLGKCLTVGDIVLVCSCVSRFWAK